jgi:type II secretory pathway component PulM
MLEFYDRTNYWLFILEIPHVRGKELMSAVKIKLNSLFPGNAADYNIQIRKNGAKKWSYLVFVLNKNTGNAMLPLSPLFVQYLYAQKSKDVLYAGKKWFDYIRIENGAISSSTVKIRDDAVLLDDVRNLCGAETDLAVYCEENDKIFFIPLQENNNVSFFDINAELKKTDAHKISLFIEKSPAKKRMKALAAASALFLLVLFSWLFYQHRQNENERSAQLRLEQEQQQRTAMEQQQENMRLLELRRQYQEIISAKTASPFDISVIIAENAEPQTRIQSATFNGNFFQIEGFTNTSLALLRNFENHRLVSSVRLHQVHPAGSMDTFTLSGTVKPETISINESLPVNRQIAILENLIASETNNTFSDFSLSPSAFGEAVNLLFSKWGCTVLSFQFMNAPQQTEIEFSLRGPGSGFFNALYEIKTRHPLWDVRLTQIKNLYPRNVLEIIIRIRTALPNPKQTSQDSAPGADPGPFPIANISRNYFLPAPPPRLAEPPAIRETPPAAAPAGMQRVNWLVYIGSVREDDNVRYIYLRNTRTGALLKLGNFNEGNMRYIPSHTGSIIAYIDDNIYEISGR